MGYVNTSRRLFFLFVVYGAQIEFGNKEILSFQFKMNPPEDYDLDESKYEDDEDQENRPEETDEGTHYNLCLSVSDKKQV